MLEVSATKRANNASTKHYRAETETQLLFSIKQKLKQKWLSAAVKTKFSAVAAEGDGAEQSSWDREC